MLAIYSTAYPTLYTDTGLSAHLSPQIDTQYQVPTSLHRHSSEYHSNHPWFCSIGCYDNMVLVIHPNLIGLAGIEVQEVPTDVEGNFNGF